MRCNKRVLGNGFIRGQGGCVGCVLWETSRRTQQPAITIHNHLKTCKTKYYQFLSVGRYGDPGYFLRQSRVRKKRMEDEVDSVGQFRQGWVLPLLSDLNSLPEKQPSMQSMYICFRCLVAHDEKEPAWTPTSHLQKSALSQLGACSAFMAAIQYPKTLNEAGHIQRQSR
jgi:hypothetical protein